jgi:hypothetical protein
MGRANHLIAIVAVVAALGLPGSIHAADALSKKPVNLAPQIAELQKEWQAYRKDPKANKIRPKPDYFKEHPNPDVTPEVVIKALEGGVSGGRGVEAYVKWQLLSGVPGKFPEELVRRAIAIYHRAPAPDSHPGLNRRDLNRALMGMQKADAMEYQHEMSEAVERLKEHNDVLLEYRDALFARLPRTIESLQAGLEDAADRANRGLNATGIFDNVSAGLRSWAITDAKPGQVDGMIGGIRRLREMVVDARPYAKIGEDKGMAKWEAGGYAIDPKRIDELTRFLENTANGAGLKFKDSNDK